MSISDHGKSAFYIADIDGDALPFLFVVFEEEVEPVLVAFAVGVNAQQQVVLSSSAPHALQVAALCAGLKRHVAAVFHCRVLRLGLFLELSP